MEAADGPVSVSDVQPEQRPAELIGAEGADYIVKRLTTGQPKQEIEDFQARFALKDTALGQCTPALELTDQMGVPRVDVFSSTLVCMREKLLNRIADAPLEQLEILLEKTFPYVGTEELRPVPLAILRRLPRIQNRFLKQLRASKELMAVLPIEVKRQIWEADFESFRYEVFPLLDAYVRDPQMENQRERLFESLPLISTASSSSSPSAPSASSSSASASSSSSSAAARATPKPSSDNSSKVPTADVDPRRRRAACTVLHDVVRMLGTSVKLYNALLHLYRVLFKETGFSAFCTLRADTLMALHDANIQSLCNIDPCYKFAWLLDATVKANSADERRLSEINSYLQTVAASPSSKSGSDPIWGDLAMIVANPFTLHPLLHHVYSALADTVRRRQLPRDCNRSLILTRLLTLGLSARTMLSERQFQEQPASASRHLMRTFYPALCAAMVDDEIRGDASADTPKDDTDPELKKQMLSNSLAAKLILCYALQRAKKKDAAALEMFLPMIEELGDKLLEEKAFMYSLVSSIINSSSDSSNNSSSSSDNDQFSEHLQLVVLDGFLLRFAEASDFALAQALRLCARFCHRIEHTKLVSLVQGLLSLGAGDVRVAEQYEALSKRLSIHLKDKPQRAADWAFLQEMVALSSNVPLAPIVAADSHGGMPPAASASSAASASVATGEADYAAYEQQYGTYSHPVSSPMPSSFSPALSSASGSSPSQSPYSPPALSPSSSSSSAFSSPSSSSASSSPKTYPHPSYSYNAPIPAASSSSSEYTPPPLPQKYQPPAAAAVAAPVAPVSAPSGQEWYPTYSQPYQPHSQPHQSYNPYQQHQHEQPYQPPSYVDPTSYHQQSQASQQDSYDYSAHAYSHQSHENPYGSSSSSSSSSSAADAYQPSVSYEAYQPPQTAYTYDVGEYQPPGGASHQQQDEYPPYQAYNAGYQYNPSSAYSSSSSKMQVDHSIKSEAQEYTPPPPHQ